MSFFECQFPTFIGFFGTSGGLLGGPTWSTIVNAGFSGFEQRNRNWASTRNKYQLDLVAKPIATVQTVLAYFLAVSGRADGFRFLDNTDFQALGQATSPAVGDGNNKVFQLQKKYSVGVGPSARSYARIISKPIMSHLNTTVGSSVNYNGSAQLTDFAGVLLADTVVMYLNGVSAPSLNAYTIDATTGLVTFTNAPGVGVNVTSDCQFHIPVRFDSDEWPGQVIPSNVAQGIALVTVTGINLLEVRIVAGQSQG